MIEIKYTGDALWERIERAVEKVKERLRRVTRALNSANIPYAVIGGNAVQHWVAQVDESVVRNTQDVDIILNEIDLQWLSVGLCNGIIQVLHPLFGHEQLEFPLAPRIGQINQHLSSHDRTRSETLF